MHDASRRLQDCLAEMYEPDWFGKEELDAMAEVKLFKAAAERSFSRSQCEKVCQSLLLSTSLFTKTKRSLNSALEHGLSACLHLTLNSFFVSPNCMLLSFHLEGDDREGDGQ